MDNNLALIVDDEQSICETLSHVLEDLGLSCCHANNGNQALEIIKEKSPALVFLDIWLPGMDGMETLEKIRNLDSLLPVVMISGHATISTAVRATQLGAIDFIEKPLDLLVIQQVVNRALSAKNSNLGNLPEIESLSEQSCQITSDVFQNDFFVGKSRQQKTLAGSSILYGVGVHSGRKSGLILEPLPENSGIHFAGPGSKQAVPAHVNYVSTTGYATTIKNADSQVSTIEHLMSALHAAGITNLLIKCNEEVPVMDGSAIEFCKIFQEVGILEQSATIPELMVTKTIEVRKGEAFIRLEPAEELIIDYTLNYQQPIGEQHYIFKMDSFENYQNEIASCRTFGFVKDIDYLQKQGLAQGGRFNNFVLIGEDGVINSELRFPDEPVRHKILDMIGDIYLLGRPIVGKITANMTGHSHNSELLRKILEAAV